MPKEYDKHADKTAARDARKAEKVWMFAGDETRPAGEVNILRKADRGAVVVRPVGGVDEFEIKRDLLSRDDDEENDDSVV